VAVVECVEVQERDERSKQVEMDKGGRNSRGERAIHHSMKAGNSNTD